MTAAADGTTGRFLVLLDDDWTEATQELNRVAGIRTADTAEVGATPSLWQADGLLMRELGVALVTADDDQHRRLAEAAAAPGPIMRVEPERLVRAIETSAPIMAGEEAQALDETIFTWGLQATGAANSTFSGEGIRVAVLDTGFDLEHPDFKDRNVVSKSFVQGEEVQDGNGHGTHCIGTSCGPREVEEGPGYGVASKAEIFAGKVLSNAGSGGDGGILSGIDWAISNRCAVVSMSLGADIDPDTAFSRIYERVAARALQRGTLIIAASGNASSRPDHIAPVGHPANCPSILAVGAIDAQRKVANFSSGTVNKLGAVDLAGPGVDVYSSYPMPLRYKRLRGTSMATPHVAGVAALIAQATGARSYELWARLAQTAERLPVPGTDVGAGLVQAP